MVNNRQQLLAEEKLPELGVQHSKQNTQISPKKLLELLTGYFLNSNEKFLAIFLLIGAALCVIATVGLTVLLTWWSAEFWALLMAKTALAPLFTSLGEFTMLLLAYVTAAVIKNFMIGKLGIHWRNWLTNKIIIDLFGSENNYLDLRRIASNIDNIAQRIQEDIKKFVDAALTLGLSFIDSVLSLAAFGGTLWVVGGALSFSVSGLSIVIPGYLVWTALLVAVMASGITQWIGRSLPQRTIDNEHAEADFRQDLAQLNREAENIAVEHAEDFYSNSIRNRRQEVRETAENKLYSQTLLIAFQSFYSQIASVIPLVVAIPLCFSGAIGLNELVEISTCFMYVNNSFNFFINSFEAIAACRASMYRIIELQNSFDKTGLPIANEKAIQRKPVNEQSIRVNHLNIMPPQAQASGSNYIIRGLSLSFNPGEHVLLQGPSGIGKSTVFKVISGSWQYGQGVVEIPSTDVNQLYFLPQRPVLPQGSLAAVLAYPQAVNTYTQVQYQHALGAVGGMNEFIPRLGESRDWADLSGGQQQRISFARALLHKPKWLFLDEATSALDEESEAHVYQTTKEQLPNTTIVSIGHRNTIRPYHSKIVFFQADNDRNASLREELVQNPQPAV